MQVFDSHVHVQPWRMIKPAAIELMKSNRGDVERIKRVMDEPDELVRLMDEEGIERMCTINYVSPDIMGFTDGVNEYGARYAKKHARRLFPYGSVHPLRTRNAKRDLDRILKLGIRGVKIHAPHQLFFPNQYRSGLKTLAAIYKTCEERGIPVMFHTGTSIFPNARNAYADPIFIDDVCVDFPKLRVILAHGGRPLWMETCFFLIRRFKNVFMDVSSVPPKTIPKYFPRLEEVADRVFFGSDWPAPGVPGMRANVDAFAALPYPDRVKRKILWENASRFYSDF